MRVIYCFTMFTLCLASFTMAAERLSWMPPEVAEEGLNSQQLGVPEIIPEIIETATPKPTADVSKYKRIYTLELKKFGISNNGTNAEATSKGLNAALQYVKTLNVNRIIFPKGTYLIDENNPIVFDHKNTIVDLGGSTLQMRTNGKSHYCVAQIVNGAENFRLTNGSLCGDRGTHDMKTVKSSFEGGQSCGYIAARIWKLII